MQILLIPITLILCLLVTACNPSTKESTEDYVLPQELKDCKVYRMSNGQSVMRALVCPHANTANTYQCGKNTCSMSTITGEIL